MRSEAKGAPMHTLCERVERFLPELFVFVAYPGVPSDCGEDMSQNSIFPGNCAAILVLYQPEAVSEGFHGKCITYIKGFYSGFDAYLPPLAKL